MSMEMGQAQCVRGCRRVEFAQVCTATPGQLHPSGDSPSICPSSSNCDDAVMHRSAGGEWHTCQGVTPSAWHAARLKQLDLLDALEAMT